MIRAGRNPAARHLLGLVVLMVATSACLPPAKTWDEVQQQIQRALEDVEPDFVFVGFCGGHLGKAILGPQAWLLKPRL